jgi:hypothetical protein
VNITGTIKRIGAGSGDPDKSIVVMNESMTINSDLNSTNCKLVSFSTVGYNNGLLLNGSTYEGFVFGGLTTANNAYYYSNVPSDLSLSLNDVSWGTVGRVATVSVNAGGQDYTVGDSLTLQAGNSQALVTVATLGVLDAVASVSLTDYRGLNYTVASSATTGGSGTGCTINVLSVTNNDTDWKTYTITSTSAKSVVGSMTDCAISIISISSDTAIVGFISSVTTEYGRFHTNTVTLLAGTWGAGTAIKRTEISIELTGAASPIGILTTKKYYYRTVLRYQDYQGSPLYQSTVPDSVILTAGQTSCLVDVFVDSTAINTRVTAVDVFRAESTSTDSNPTTQYRLVITADIRSGWALEASGAWTTRRRYSFYDTGNYGVSYETEYGIPETLPNNRMDYAVSCLGAGYLFVTQGYNSELEVTSGNVSLIQNIIYRSKRNAPDTFDWSNDFLVLPVRTVALHYFKGYLYAFDNSTMFVIDPENLVLVGRYDGYGVTNSLAVTSNESAMFFANKDNIFMHDGKSPIVISEPINQVGTLISGVTSHRTLATTSSMIISMTIMAKYNCLVVAYLKALSGSSECFVFDLNKKAWYYWLLEAVTGIEYNQATIKRSIFNDYLGNLYLSVSGGIAKICGDTAGKVATWYSKLIDLGDQTTLKKIYKVIFNGTCDGYIAYNSPTAVTTAITSGSYLAAFTTKQTSMQLKFLFTTGEILRGITVIFRKTLGLR